jgi:predicted TIM-barrel fold metal-dependent hydrolase
MIARTGDLSLINRRNAIRGGTAVAGMGLLGAISRSVQAQQRPPIIDMHMHARMNNTRLPNGNALPRPCVPLPCAGTPAAFTGEGAILRGTLDAMERYNIVLGVVSGTPADVDQWVRAAPGRFLPSTGIFEGILTGSTVRDIAELRREFTSGRFKAMGEIGTQYRGLAPNDARFEPFFALAEELNLPTWVHTLGLGAPVPDFRSSQGHPLLLEDVVIQHPRLRLYFENAGYPFLDEAIALMTQYGQVYADLSTITWLIPQSAFDRYVRALVEAGLATRLMFGSDAGEFAEAIGLGIERVQSATYLTTEQKRDILYNNAARFLRLDANGRLPQ